MEEPSSISMNYKPQNEKIGILGGTFDPIHLGHIHVASAAQKEYELDRVCFMAAGDPYFKRDTYVTPVSLRIEMINICLEEINNPGFFCSDFEASKAGPTYTAETLAGLKALYPHWHLYFIVGLDTLKAMKTWYEPGFIFKNACILCASRDTLNQGLREILEIADEYEKLFSTVQPDIRLIHTSEIDISSTQIRDKARDGDDISPFLTEGVYDFIKSRKLYN